MGRRKKISALSRIYWSPGLQIRACRLVEMKKVRCFYWRRCAGWRSQRRGDQKEKAIASAGSKRPWLCLRKGPLPFVNTFTIAEDVNGKTSNTTHKPSTSLLKLSMPWGGLVRWIPKALSIPFVTAKTSVTTAISWSLLLRQTLAYTRRDWNQGLHRNRTGFGLSQTQLLQQGPQPGWMPSAKRLIQRHQKPSQGFLYWKTNFVLQSLYPRGRDAQYHHPQHPGGRLDVAHCIWERWR